MANIAARELRRNCGKTGRMGPDRPETGHLLKYKGNFGWIMRSGLIPFPQNWDKSQAAVGMGIFDQAHQFEAGLPPILGFFDRVERHGHTAKRIGHWHAGGMKQTIGHRSVGGAAPVLFTVEHRTAIAGRGFEFAQDRLVFFARSAACEIAARSFDLDAAFIGHVEIALHARIPATMARITIAPSRTASR